MADDTTPLHGFVLPEVGSSQDSWGDKLNTNWTAVDGLLPEVTSTTIEVGPSGATNVQFDNLPPGIRHMTVAMAYVNTGTFAPTNAWLQIGTFANDFNHVFISSSFDEVDSSFNTHSNFFLGTDNQAVTNVELHAVWELFLVDSIINHRWICHGQNLISTISYVQTVGVVALNNVLDKVKVQLTSTGTMETGKVTLNYR